MSDKKPEESPDASVGGDGEHPERIETMDDLKDNRAD